MGDEAVLDRILNGEEDPKNLPLALLQSITNDFSHDRKIGQGGFGEVYKGVYNGEKLAVKLFYDLPALDNKQFENECVNLLRIRHPNIVRLLGYCYETQRKHVEYNGELQFAQYISRILCFEYLQGGSLDKYLNESRDHDWPTRYNIIEGTCEGLNFLHGGCGSQILHLDLKPANILLDKYMGAKVADFGLSRFFSKTHTHITNTTIGTEDYMAPEFRFKNQISPKNDVYSLGIIIIEIMVGRGGYLKLWEMDDVTPFIELVLAIWRGRIHPLATPFPSAELDQVETCIKIAIKCVDPDRKNRPTVAQIFDTLQETEKRFLEEWRNQAGFLVGQSLPTPTKSGPRGGSGGKLVDIKEEPWRLHSLTISYQGLIDALSFSYIDQSGKKQRVGPWGEENHLHKIETIRFCPSEFVEEVCGAYGSHGENILVTSLTFVTNIRTYGPFGNLHHQNVAATPFKYRADEGSSIVGFHGRSGSHLFSIGVYMYPNNKIPVILKGQAKWREINESASGKGKLGSSEKAEAAFMDIKAEDNVPSKQSSVICTHQTEQRNLHPPQSFSRHYPANKTYLGEGSRAVDVARGAMGSLLDKLGKLVKEDYNLESSMKRDIQSFSEDLKIIHKDLPQLEKLDGVKFWIDEVRELSYHIEDMVDSFMVHVEPNSSRSGFREIMHESVKLWENGMTTDHQIGDVIRDIKDKVQAVADRQKKYNFDVKNVVANATTKAIIDLRISAIYEHKEQLVGIKAPRDELIRLLQEDGDASKQKLKIISIVGMGGLGKTTLAKQVYDKMKPYHPKAFVSVGQNPDVETVLKDILSRIGKDFNAKNLGVHGLINELQELLKKKRYFIVIDDIWDFSSWDAIKSAFPRDKCGSRVIITTRNEHVALNCCKAEIKYVYKMKPLSDKYSRRLFFRRIFGPQEDCPDIPRKEEISKYILKKCGGMPLAINSIASLLAGAAESTWEYIWKSLGSVTEGDDLEKMNQILDLSYIHLPDHLKTCLLYVCMYPEDREIDKNDLLRKWVAEGFVHVSRNSGLDAEDVAEKYFKELMSRCMIQPGEIDVCSNEVLSCRVHDIILDLMRSKSSKENFIHVIDGSKDEVGEIRRVSVQYNDEEDTRISETISKGSLSHVRSVLLCQRSLVPYFLEFKYVRVLHIEYDEESSQIEYGLDLTCINRLFLLRYLKIACIPFVNTFELKLPNQIGELQQLETIDIAEATLENPPSDIVSLPWLSHLSLWRLVLPDGIDRLKSLRTLEGVDVFESSVENIKGLSKLTKLRKLKITSYYSTEWVKEATMDALLSSICELLDTIDELLANLESFIFEIVPDLAYVQGWITRTPFPRGSRIHVHETTMDALFSSICKVSANLRSFIFERVPDLAYVRGWITRTPFPRGSHIHVHEPTMDALFSSICKLSANLRSFIFERVLDLADVRGWITRTPFPQGSHIQELDLEGCRFERCPEWIGQLHGLYKISISVREVADGVSIVARLPSLAYFHLTIFGMGEEEKEESVVIPGTGSGAFQALKHLVFWCKKASLTFEAGAMPKLEQLDIMFHHLMTPQLLPVGVQHLPTGTLKQIFLRTAFKDGWELLEGAFKPHHPAADIIINGTKL